MSRVLPRVLVLLLLGGFCWIPSAWSDSGDSMCEYVPGRDKDVAIPAVYAPKIRAIFVTFPDVVEATGDSSLPSYADELTVQFTDFLADMSRGAHLADFRVVKRPGADSVSAWVTSRTSDHYVSVGVVQDDLYPRFAQGWDDGLDLPVFFFSAKPSCCGARGLSSQHLTSRNNYLYVRYGDLTNQGYIEQTPWLVKGILVHEYGHQLGAGHLPDGTSGTTGWCFGGYWSCYGAMDRGIFTGCDGWQEFDGFVPYHPYNLLRFRWLINVELRSSRNGVRLADVRRSGQVVTIPVPGLHGEYFLLVNHQMTGYDAILNGRGLLIWHIRELRGSVACTALSKTLNDIFDLEHQAGMWRIDLGSPAAPLWPHRPDPIGGRDTLDYSPQMHPSAFFNGLSLGGAPVRSSKAFGRDTNPASFRYVESADDRRDLQPIDSGIEISCIEAVPDPDAPGKYIMQFDVAKH